MTIVRLLYLIWIAVPAALPRAVPYKVAWYGGLELPSHPSFERLLTERLGKTWRAILNDGSDRPIKTCKDVLAVKQMDVNHLSPDNGAAAWYSLQTDAVRCFALEILRTAKPASKSYIGWFKFSRAGILRLPAGVTPSFQKDETKRVAKAAVDCTPLGSYDRRLTLDIDFDYKQADLTGDGWTGHIFLYARGDLNGDGIEDLLFERDAAVLADDIDFAHATQELFIVTQTSVKACPQIVWSLRDWRGQPHPLARPAPAPAP